VLSPRNLDLVRLTRTTLASVILVLGTTLSLTNTSDAQYGGRGGMATMFMPDFLARDLPVFVDSLQLEEWQRPILEALLDDYNTNFTTAADGVRASMGQLKDVAAGTSPDKVIELVSRPLVAWTEEKAKLRADFLANVKSQLGDSQTELWPRFERAMRREKCLPNGELSGETLNLFFIMRELDASTGAADAARLPLDEYELNLDAALAAREELLESSVAPLLKAMSSSDAQGGVQLQEQIMARRVAVRTVQDAAIVAIRDALGAEYGPKFERSALQRAFPQVYRPDPVTPLFEAAQSLPDLTDEQKSQLKSLFEQFNMEWPAFQVKMADGYRFTEPREPRRRTEMAAAKAAGGTIKYAEAPELEVLKSERDALFTKYRERISAILNDAQKQAIPGMGKVGADAGDSTPYGGDVNVIGPGNAEPEAPAKPDGAELSVEGQEKPSQFRSPKAPTLGANSKTTPPKGAKQDK